MKFVVFGPDRRLGVIQRDQILDLAQAARTSQRPPDRETSFVSLPTLIESGDRGLDQVRLLMDRFAEDNQSDVHVPLSTTMLHAPFPGRRFALAGSNHATHVAHGLTNRGRPITPEEVHARTRAGKAGGFWVVSPPVGPAAEIPIPRSAQGLFDYEGEVAVVLANGGKRLRADQWEHRIWGTTLVIDWSIRSQDEITFRAPFYGHKNFDNSKSMGPWIAVDEVNPASCDVTTRVNGEVRQQFNSSEMMHSFGELLEQMSEDFTLLPGDVLSGGTGAGTAVDSTVVDSDGKLPLDKFLHDGDTVEVSSPGLGTLNAHIVGLP